MTKITAHEAAELLNYDPSTGVLSWRKNPAQHVKAGAKAGRINRGGYVEVGIKGRVYLAHRVIWLMVTGEWPTGHIDHRNGVRSDNRWDNMRDVTPTQNAQNRRAAGTANKSSGLLGVTLHRQTGKWQAQIETRGKSKHLGLFDDPQVAHQRYLEAKREMHEACTI